MSKLYGFWTVNGSTTFGTMPGGILPGIAEPVPIVLQVGNNKWGATHIDFRHSSWLAKNSQTAASMVYKKLGQSGTVFTTEAADKTKVNLTITPAALLVLQYIPKFQYLTVTTIFFKDDKLDGTYLGRYVSGQPYVIGPQPVLVFAPPVPVVQAIAVEPAIQYKKKRHY